MLPHVNQSLMNWKRCNDAKRSTFRLMAAGRSILDKITILIERRIAKAPLHHTSSIPRRFRIAAENTEISQKFYLRFFFMGRNLFIARTRSSRVLRALFSTIFDASACFPLETDFSMFLAIRFSPTIRSIITSVLVKASSKRCYIVMTCV